MHLPVHPAGMPGRVFVDRLHVLRVDRNYGRGQDLGPILIISETRYYTYECWPTMIQSKTQRGICIIFSRAARDDGTRDISSLVTRYCAEYDRDLGHLALAIFRKLNLNKIFFVILNFFTQLLQ